MLFSSLNKSQDNTKTKTNLDPLAPGSGLFSYITEPLHLLSNPFMNFTRKLVTYFFYLKKKAIFMLFEGRITSSVSNYYSKKLSFVSHKCYSPTMTTHPVKSNIFKKI